MGFLIWKSNSDLTIVTALKMTHQSYEAITLIANVRVVVLTCQSSLLSIMHLAYALNFQLTQFTQLVMFESGQKHGSLLEFRQYTL